jgi:3-oxoacyl-[acyl-carrier-protein] synthase-3
LNGTIRSVRIAGIASAVPAQVMSSLETAGPAGISPEEAQKIANMTGVHNRHVAPSSCCTSDLACAAARRLLEDPKWEPESIDALAMVSQNHDYDLPATACILQDRLGLSHACSAFDMSLGCSGYVYGLWVCSGIVSGGARRVLLLAGDTISRTSAPQDRSTVFLFGDAGTATALEQDANAPDMTFVLGTDGSGKEFLIIPDSGFRNRSTPGSFVRRRNADGSVRGPLDLYMDGAEVFAFTLREVPPMMAEVLSASGWTLEEMDAFVPHQANQFILQHLGKRLKIPAGKMVLSLDEFGNTSSASIPLSLSYRLGGRLRQERMKLILAGFGVGWSWGAATVTCGPMVMPEIIYVPEPAVQPAAS